MKIIGKTIVESSLIDLPRDFKFLSIQYQGNDVCIWGIGDYSRLETRRIYKIGTGWNLERSAQYMTEYLGTLQERGFVWHFFFGAKEVRNDPT